MANVENPNKYKQYQMKDPSSWPYHEKLQVFKHNATKRSRFRTRLALSNPLPDPSGPHRAVTEQSRIP